MVFKGNIQFVMTRTDLMSVLRISTLKLQQSGACLLQFEFCSLSEQPGGGSGQWVDHRVRCGQIG